MCLCEREIGCICVKERAISWQGGGGGGIPMCVCVKER